MGPGILGHSLDREKRTEKGAAAKQVQVARKLSSYHERLARIKAQYPRAYERWTAEEEDKLLTLKAQGVQISDISLILQRQPSAIRTRLARLELKKQQDEGRDSPWEQRPQLSSHALRSITVDNKPKVTSFLPLAVSSMQGDAVCIAGVDVETLEWIRVVCEGLYSMKKSHTSWFQANKVYGIYLLRSQQRPLNLDPWALHVEDWVIKEKPRLVREISPAEKLHILQNIQDEDLKAVLSSEQRSLFLIEPKNFQVIYRDDKSPKIAFSTGHTNTDDLRNSPALKARHIGISSLGCPCTALRWAELVRQLGKIKDERAIKKLGDDVKTYFALSLTAWPLKLPEEKRKHYLLVAGIHVVGRGKIWL